VSIVRTVFAIILYVSIYGYMDWKNVVVLARLERLPVIGLW
jgi:hypothetical protein